MYINIIHTHFHIFIFRHKPATRGMNLFLCTVRVLLHGGTCYHGNLSCCSTLTSGWLSLPVSVSHAEPTHLSALYPRSHHRPQKGRDSITQRLLGWRVGDVSRNICFPFGLFILHNESSFKLVEIKH